MFPTPEESLRQALLQVTTGGFFSEEQMSDLVDLLMQIDLGLAPYPQLAGALICSLKTRGESVAEIVGAARSLRQHQVSVTIESHQGLLLDTCGTGGDGAHLINLSTLTGLVMAALGVPVAKHGNRSVSSACGSADLLEEMGYPLHSCRESVARCVQETGFGFFFAPHFHPALKNLAGLRRSLGVRTMFNLLGPLVNPAGATHQLIGVFDRNLVSPLARAACDLGLERCLVVHGQGGLDELSPCGPSWVSLAGRGEFAEMEWTPKNFGAKPVSLDALRGGDAAENAYKSQKFLAGESSDIAAAVAMNCAACLWLIEKVESLEEGYRQSFEAIQSGQVGEYFEEAKTVANSFLSHID